MGRFFGFLCLLAAFSPIVTLGAQETGGGETPAQNIFPLTPVLEGALYAGDACAAWRPDWPLALPPDAFRVNNGEITHCVIERGGMVLGYRVGSGGLVEEFPFMLDGRMAQVSLVYREFSELREMTVTFPAGNPPVSEAVPVSGGGEESAETLVEVPPETPYRFEFLEWRDNVPIVVRVSRDAWYFIYFSWGVDEVIETWYDEEGKFLGAYNFTLSKIGKTPRIRAIRDYGDTGNGRDRELFYGSRGFLTDSVGSGGVYRTLYYLENLPRYWERRPAREDSSGAEERGKFFLQWDERGLLVRISGERDGIEPGGTEPADYRYEYVFDEKGNWTERREVRLYRRSGLLVPSPGVVIRRILEYSE